jgi:probable rRNA maturation factor
MRLRNTSGRITDITGGKHESAADAALSCRSNGADAPAARFGEPAVLLMEESMKLQLHTAIETDEKFNFSMKIVARRVIRKALEQEKFPCDAEISLLITGPDEVQALNRAYRNIDSTTDVLSFPALSYDHPSDFAAALQDAADCFDPEYNTAVLGDIVINAARVREQAREYGHSEEREFAFLVAHSMMHLCGYDHMNEKESAVMEKKQDAVLQALGITRG